MKLFGNELRITDLMKRIGDISQLGGLNFYEFTDGQKKGLRAVDIKCPSGLSITVILDRAMDISNCFFNNIPICWRSVTRETSPYYYDNRTNEWLRTFFGGLLTTCGLENTGIHCKDKNEELGLHGRISNIAAESINSYSEWENEDYKICLEGTIRNTKVFGDKLELKRKITTFFIEPILTIEDCVTNIGFDISPVMILYHINFGYPLIDKDARIIEAKASVTGKDEISKKSIDKYDKFSEPIKGFKEMAYYHDISADGHGYSNIAILNEALNNRNGLGVLLRFKKDNLPILLQWKQMGEGEYVCGIEPANCFTRGRATEKENRTLKFINPGESLKYRIELRFISTITEINSLKDMLKRV